MRYLETFVAYFLAIVWVIPLVWIVLNTFQPNNISSFSLIGGNWTLENIKTVWEGAPFAQYYLNTFIIVTGILFVQFITITLAAYAFARLNFFGKNIIFLIFLIQIMIPADVLISPNYLILRDLSLLDTKLGIMIPHFASAIGIFILRQTFKSIPYELEESAKMDGCSLLRIIWHVYVPLAKPTFLAFSLISVSYHWNNFLWPLIITSSVENRPLTVGLAIFAMSADTGAQWATVSAATFMVIFPLVLAFFIFQKQFISSFMHSGIR
ncbi:carbohydrate ABC transporter permease [Pseudogracilibacillus auburnensis]|uniref:Carbohydrate ABC transporter membrane protein 2 (CUT1 family) n=1 Tax=Pseudogracilibacillus auburnensis TaxID=1494959 RepID=A0A2V3WB11_9BACI|nr:carbohydrate ABC transporter permease [Pseudogracilibacillus auburnensis]MBO1001967.1 carbohydrate ABC transporter permease [Pseudogracilibacillus auburnensis]PXW90191.1 carbohydrate ABC transporter membrane protein 2 (CUT1 family) [Pseudogracilibacillus auburnensis]